MKDIELQIFPRVHRTVFFIAVLAVPAVLAAQQTPATSSTSTEKSTKIPVKGLPVDAIKVLTAMKESYYRPDDLSGLGCTVSLDWGAFFTAMKQTPSPDRLKALQAMKIHSDAVRGQKTKFTFDWSGGTLDTKDQLEGGVEKMVGGFYDMYWPMMPSFPIPKADEIKEIVPQADGGAMLSLPSAGINVTVIVDKNNVPTNLSFENPMMKGSFDLRYQPSPDPVPGDLRRITGLKVAQSVGTTNSSIRVGVDYQAVGGYHIPKHVDVDLGSFSIGVDFSDCSVSKVIEMGHATKE
jgi:hypothetical protein